MDDHTIIELSQTHTLMPKTSANSIAANPAIVANAVNNASQGRKFLRPCISKCYDQRAEDSEHTSRSTTSGSSTANTGSRIFVAELGLQDCFPDIMLASIAAGCFTTLT